MVGNVQIQIQFCLTRKSCSCFCTRPSLRRWQYLWAGLCSRAPWHGPPSAGWRGFKVSPGCKGTWILDPPCRGWRQLSQKQLCPRIFPIPGCPAWGLFCVDMEQEKVLLLPPPSPVGNLLVDRRGFFGFVSRSFLSCLLLTHTIGLHQRKLPFSECPVWYSETHPQHRGAPNTRMCLLRTYYTLTGGGKLCAWCFQNCLLRKRKDLGGQVRAQGDRDVCGIRTLLLDTLS